jgi:hypothetical protein
MQQFLSRLPKQGLLRSDRMGEDIELFGSIGKTTKENRIEIIP